MRLESMPLSVIRLAGEAGTIESPVPSAAAYARSSAGVTVNDGPGALPTSGWSRRITRAVITLATLPIGTGPD